MGKRNDNGNAGTHFLQCNLQKAKQAQMLFNGKVGGLNKSSSQFICLVQEPYVGKQSVALQPNSCKKYYIGKQPRAIIYTDKARDSWMVESLSTSDMIVIHTKIENQETLVVSSYLDINNDAVITNELEELLAFATRKGLAVLIGMDSNCHSVIYGLETNTRGEKLEEFIAETGLEVVNIGKEPTYESRGNSTRIDITLTRDSRYDILEWEVDRRYNASDHNTIKFKIGRDKIILPKTWKWHKAEWEKLSDSLLNYKTTMPNVIKDEDCEKELTNIYRYINSAMKKSIPKSKAAIVDKNNPWWNLTLKKQRNTVSKLYQKQIKSPTEANISNYKAEHRSYKAACEKARKDSWRKLQQGIDNIQDMNNFRKIIETGNKITLGTLTKDDGTITDPGKDTVKYLLSKHFPDGQPIKPTLYSSKTVKKTDINAWKPDWITTERLTEVFKLFKSKKSPGTDGLSPMVLKHLPPEFLKHIVHLYKCLIKLNFTPTRWKESKMVFIPKPGKETYKVYKSWRGISLTNYFLKALEKLCCWHTDEKIAQYPIHPRQHGFRNDRSTETALSNVVNYIEKYINNGEHVLAVFLDIQAAFDTISTDKIYEELIKHNVDKNLAKWYYNYISHRNMYTTINGITEAITTTTGFPQGGVCSAKFWIIAFNEAIEILNQRGVYGVGFADDCAALLGGNNLHQQMSRIQKIVTDIEDWGRRNGLVFNALKTEVVIFTRARLREAEYPNKLIMGDNRIDFGTSVKYLGILLDAKLSWTINIELKIKKAKRTLFALRQAISKKWGPKPAYMKWLYNSIVKSRILYGVVVWGVAIRHKNLKEKLNKLNYLAVSMISNTRKTTPRLALEIMYDLPPLHLIIIQEALAAIARNRAVIVKDWPGYNKKHRTLIGHVLYWERQAREIGLRLENTDAFKADKWEKYYRVNLESFANKGPPVHTQINIYTDGSKTEEHVGSGYVIYHKGTEIISESIRLEEEITVYQAEVLAIKVAAQKFLSIKTPDLKFVKIFSDSQAALKSLANWKVRSKLVYETMDTLNALARACIRVELVWIKAHHNYAGNERADELARNAVFNNVVLFSTYPPHSYFKRQLSAGIYDKWAEIWLEQNTCRMTKIFYPYPHKGKSRELLHLSRKQSRRLIEIVTGQNNLNYIQNKVTGQDHLCRFCEESEETFDHLFLECPCFESLRRGQNLEHCSGTHDWKIQTLLNFANTEGIDKALRQSGDNSDSE